MHQNRASPFASDFYRRRGYRREFRSEDHFFPFSSQKKSRFASDFLRRRNRASWGLDKSRDFRGSGKNRHRSRRESRDFGALSRGSKKFILARTHEKNHSPRTTFSFSLEIFILGLKISFSIENFNPRPCFSAAREGPGMKISLNHSQLKISFHIESLTFFNTAPRD